MRRGCIGHAMHRGTHQVITLSVEVGEGGFGARPYHHTGVCENNLYFTRALAMQSCSRNCFAAPDSVFLKLIVLGVFLFGGVFVVHRHRYHAMSEGRGDGPVRRGRRTRCGCPGAQRQTLANTCLR